MINILNEFPITVCLNIICMIHMLTIIKSHSSDLE